MKTLRNSRHMMALIVAVAVALALLPLPIPASAQGGGGTIAYGDVVTGYLSNQNPYESWVFNGRQGDQIQATMIDAVGTLDPYLFLIEVNSETILTEDDDSYGQPNATLTYTLPSTGSYLVVATRYGVDQGDSYGDYVLELLGTTGVPDTGPVNPGGEMVAEGVYYMGPVELGTPVYGTLTNASFAHLYDIYLDAGTQVAAYMEGDATLDAYLAIGTDADGILVEDDDSGGGVNGMDAFATMTIPQSGVYLFCASRSGVDAGTSTGNYMLLVGIPDVEENTQPADTIQPVDTNGQQQAPGLDLPSGFLDMGVMAVNGPAASGTIDNVNYVHAYQMYAGVGDQITISMQGGATLDPFIALMDVQGEIVAGDGGYGLGSTVDVAYTIPVDGWYVLLASRTGIDEGTSTGGYTLQVTTGGTSDQAAVPSTSELAQMLGVSNLPKSSSVMEFEFGDPDAPASRSGQIKILIVDDEEWWPPKE
ncbi:MAG: hypothetical protein JXJ20_07510 [Anaerolineae bacterium]|nr:hypothetical protein [Anaerolineae bacterium]